MKQEDAERSTKYFSEGVKAGIWCYADDGNWSVTVAREGSQVHWLGIDNVLRSVLHLRNQIERGEQRPELFDLRGDFYPELVIAFFSQEDAIACLRVIHEAVLYVQARTQDDAWTLLTLDVFNVPQPASQ